MMGDVRGAPTGTGATHTELPSVPAGTDPKRPETLRSQASYSPSSAPEQNDVIVINNSSEHPGPHKSILVICA